MRQINIFTRKTEERLEVHLKLKTTWINVNRINTNASDYYNPVIDYYNPLLRFQDYY